MCVLGDSRALLHTLACFFLGPALTGSLQKICFLTGTFWVLPLTYIYLPNSARAYLFPQSVKVHYFCSSPISVDPVCPQANPSLPGGRRGPPARRAVAGRRRQGRGPEPAAAAPSLMVLPPAVGGAASCSWWCCIPLLAVLPPVSLVCCCLPLWIPSEEDVRARQRQVRVPFRRDRSRLSRYGSGSGLTSRSLGRDRSHPMPRVLASACWRRQGFGRGDDKVGNPHRAQIFQFELFELILLLK